MDKENEMINLDIKNYQSSDHRFRHSVRGDTMVRHSSLKPMNQGSALLGDNQRQASVKFAMHHDSSKNFNSINSNLTIAKESHFNQRYNDYLRRVKEVNKAKQMLKNNRDAMSLDIKRQLVKHIKHKCQIVELIEQELAMESAFVRAYQSSVMSGFTDEMGGVAVSNDNVVDL